MNSSVTWSGSYGAVETNGIVFPIGTKPNFSFEFDSVYYEPVVNNKFKVIGTERYELSDEEVSECQNFSATFLDTADYPVQTVEEDTMLYAGSMMRSEAVEKGLTYFVGPTPDFPVARYVQVEGETGITGAGHWEKIVCVIKDDGWYVIEPDGICPKCVVFMNQSEWDAFPKPTKGTQIWDFASETWKDYRTVERARNNLIEYIRNTYNPKRQEVLGGFTPQAEMSSWPIQLEEAKAYKNNKDASTPFIDATLVALNGAKTKDEFVNDILEYNSDTALTQLGTLHGEEYGWILKVRAASTLDEVDSIEAEFAKALGVQTFTRPVSGF